MSGKIYLDYDKVVDVIMAHPGDIRQILNGIDELPEEPVTEVVRCGECKNWDKSWKSIYGTKGHYCWLVEMFTKSKDYCSNGKPK